MKISWQRRWNARWWYFSGWCESLRYLIDKALDYLSVMAAARHIYINRPSTADKTETWAEFKKRAVDGSNR